MSAKNLTLPEKQDLVTLVLPRVIVQALSNTDGEFYDETIFDEAVKKALKEID